MAIHIHCPHCHMRLEEMQQECTHCGTSLPAGVLAALACALGGNSAPMVDAASTPLATQRALTASFSAQLRAVDQATAVRRGSLRPWLAASLSLLWGVGQLYNGQMRKGVVLMSCGVVAVLSWPFLLGKIFACGLWLYAITDAYLVARRTL